MEHFAADAGGGNDRLVQAGEPEETARQAEIRRLARACLELITAEGPVFARPAHSRVPCLGTSVLR
jgi:hypothetical protein